MSGRKSTRSSKNDSRKIAISPGSTKSKELEGKPHVTITVLKFGTDIDNGFQFSGDEIVCEDQLFIPKDASGEQVESIIGRYMKVALPGYRGTFKIGVNPEDLMKVVIQLYMAAAIKDGVHEGDDSPGSIIRLIGHLYVLLEDPHDSLPERDSLRPKKRSNPDGLHRDCEDSDNNDEPAPKKIRALPPSQIEFQNARLPNEDESVHHSTNYPRALNLNLNNGPKPSLASTAKSLKRKLDSCEEADEQMTSKLMTLAESYSYVLRSVNRFRPVKKAVRRTSAPRD